MTSCSSEVGALKGEAPVALFVQERRARASVKQACRVPNFYTLIEPDGRALPCCLVAIPHQGGVGNVMDRRPLSDVWSGEEFETFRRDRIPFCQRCSSPRNMTLGLILEMRRQFRE